ncbi:MAG TPA: glycosyltransferase [Sphingobacteriaceae bacterium]|nr:glycosyltransferase [Sphingobacteriaceae bacterium]
MANTLFIASIAVIWVMLLYNMILTRGGYSHYRRYRQPIAGWKKSSRPLPKVSIMIPAHNEELVLERTLQAMVRQDYPRHKLEIIVINDNSSDRTGAIADAFATRYPFVKVVHLAERNAGRGKPGALNRGLPHATGDAVVVYDADNTPERRAVYYLALALVNSPGVGAVVGKFRVINARENFLTRFINVETICFQWMAQAGRHRLFGITTIPGTNFIIWRSLLDELGGWQEQALAEDTELSIRVYNAGYRIIFFPAAVTWEQEPETWPVWWRQRVRWARGNLNVVVKYLFRIPWLANKRIALDIIHLFAMYLLFFLSVTTSNVLFVGNLLFDWNLGVGEVATVLWVMAYALFISQAMLALSLEGAELNRDNFFIVLLMYFTYCQLWVPVVIYAMLAEIKRFFLRGEAAWYKTQRFTRRGRLRTHGPGVDGVPMRRPGA